MTASALAGVRALEIADGWSAAALAGRLLGELGAEVAKVEAPSGDTLRRDALRAPDGESIAFHFVAATKRSVVLDPRGAAGTRVLERLFAWADIVLMDAYGVATLRRGGLAVEDLCRSWPHLVACAITPFGVSGPLRGWSAGELTLQAMSGVMASTGSPDRPPARAGVPLGAHVGALMVNGRLTLCDSRTSCTRRRTVWRASRSTDPRCVTRSGHRPTES